MSNVNTGTKWVQNSENLNEVISFWVNKMQSCLDQRMCFKIWKQNVSFALCEDIFEKNMQTRKCSNLVYWRIFEEGFNMSVWLFTVCDPEDNGFILHFLCAHVTHLYAHQKRDENMKIIKKKFDFGNIQVYMYTNLRNSPLSRGKDDLYQPCLSNKLS